MNIESIKDIPGPRDSGFADYFVDVYLNGPYVFEYGLVKWKANGEPERGKLQDLEGLCHEFQLHPESVVALRKRLRLIRPDDRRDASFRHLAYAMGAALGRFDRATGTLFKGTAAELPEYVLDGLYFTALWESRDYTREKKASVDENCIKHLRELTEEHAGQELNAPIWKEMEAALLQSGNRKKSWNEFMRQDCFEIHKKIYEGRPIYFPLSSEKKNFVFWASIHAWRDGYLSLVLSEYLLRDQKYLAGRIEDFSNSINESSGKERSALEKSKSNFQSLKSEMDDFIELLTKIAEKGPEPEAQETQCKFVMDLDDGVMINSAALWPLLKPQWKDPEKWWNSIKAPSGKHDYDWSHMAMRYWPNRVWKKLKEDPSLAVAHSNYGPYQGRDLFEELHPEAAAKWKKKESGEDGDLPGLAAAPSAKKKRSKKGKKKG